MLPADRRGGCVHLINTCIDTSLNDLTAGDGVKNKWFRRNRMNVADCEIIFGLTMLRFWTIPFGRNCFVLREMVHLFIF